MTSEPEQAPGEMRVIVITHADAKYPEPVAEPRPLTPTGRGQSQLAAMRLKQLIPDLRPPHIVSSPKRRCVQTAELVASGLGFPDRSITLADLLLQPGPAENGRKALQEALASAEGHTDVIVCGHGDMANCFQGQIDESGLARDDKRYFARGPAIVVFHGRRDGNWKIDVIEILKEDTAEFWQDVRCNP
jgi:phosphohistidine phosphatase SixA